MIAQLKSLFPFFPCVVCPLKGFDCALRYSNGGAYSEDTEFAFFDEPVYLRPTNPPSISDLKRGKLLCHWMPSLFSSSETLSLNADNSLFSLSSDCRLCQSLTRHLVSKYLCQTYLGSNTRPQPQAHSTRWGKFFFSLIARFNPFYDINIKHYCPHVKNYFIKFTACQFYREKWFRDWQRNSE